MGVKLYALIDGRFEMYFCVCFIGQYSWIFTESNLSMEIPFTGSDCQADWSHLQSSIFGKFCGQIFSDGVVCIECRKDVSNTLLCKF